MPDDRRPRLLKLSGEALGTPEAAFHHPEIDRVGAEIVAGQADGPVAVVVGGGNIVRGASLKDICADPARGDYMGMLATLINAVALKDAIERAGGRCEVMAPHEVPNVAQRYDRERARNRLATGSVVVFGGGTGHPFFTTDTAAALRAAEIGAAVLLKATTVDGVYDSDPAENPDARRFDEVSFDECLGGRFAVMDMAAFSLCRDQAVPIRVFDMRAAGAVRQALGKTPPGTLVR